MAVTDNYDFWNLDPAEAMSDFPTTWNWNIDKIDTAIHDAATAPVSLSRLPNFPAGKVTSGRFADARIPTTVARTSEISALESRIAKLESGPRSTGPRNITSLLKDVKSGYAFIERNGNTVVLSLDTIRFGDDENGGWKSLLSIPAGFKPNVTLRENLSSASQGHQIALYTNGDLSSNRDKGYTLRNVFTYFTNDSWPSSLPGDPA